MERIHVSLAVGDLARATGFYTGLFGEEPTKVRDDYVNFRLDSPPIMLALQEKRGADSGASGGVGHLGIELPDRNSLGNWRSRLESRGIEFEPEEKADCCYATGSKLWTRDPDGNVWEIWVRTGEGSQVESKSSTCCV